MRNLAAALAFVLALPVVAIAQEEPQGSKWTDVEWFEIVQVDFKAGKTDDAMDMINENFKPTTAAAGTPWPVMILEHETGEWDLTVIWRMEEGPRSMEWQQSPNSQKWWAKMIERTGSEEAAEEMMAKYQSYIARTNSYIVRQGS